MAAARGSRNRRRVYKLTTTAIWRMKFNLNVFLSAGGFNASRRTANSLCLIGLFTLLDAAIDRHIALSIQSQVCCPCLDRSFFQDISTLNVC